LKPAFEDLRLDVQQRLFEGLDKTVTNLGNAWIPALKVTLGSYADTFNGFFKNLGSSITTPKFISDLQAGAEGFRQGFEDIGTAITDSLVPAFGALAGAAGPFLSQLGTEIADLVTDFSNWVLQGEKTGSLKDFFANAATSLHDIFQTGKLAVKIAGQIIGIIIGTNQDGKKTPLESFNESLEKVSTWLTAHKKEITDFLTGIGNKVTAFNSKVEGIGNFLDQIFPPELNADGTTRGDSFGREIGKAVFAGLIAGVGEAMKASLTFFVDNILLGPFIGQIKAGLGIASPSTVFIEIGHNVVEGLIQGVGEFIASLTAKAGEIATTVIGAVGSGADWLVSAGKNAVIGIANGIVSLLGTLGTTAGNIRATVINAASSAGTWLSTAGKNVVIGLRNGITSLVSSAGSTAGAARTYITNAFANAGNLLVNAGRNVMVGLINGIAGMIGTLGNYLGQVGQYIVAHKGPPSKDKVLLFGAGQLIMGGLVDGIEDKKATLAAQLADVTSLVAGTDMPALASDLGGVAGSLTSSAGLEIGIRQGTTGDWLLDGLRRSIEVKYRGNAVAALGTA
jgi:hypothetical protein